MKKLLIFILFTALSAWCLEIIIDPYKELDEETTLDAYYYEQQTAECDCYNEDEYKWR